MLNTVVQVPETQTFCSEAYTSVSSTRNHTGNADPAAPSTLGCLAPLKAYW